MWKLWQLRHGVHLRSDRALTPAATGVQRRRRPLRRRRRTRRPRRRRRRQDHPPPPAMDLTNTINIGRRLSENPRGAGEGSKNMKFSMVFTPLANTRHRTLSSARFHPDYNMKHQALAIGTGAESPNAIAYLGTPGFEERVLVDQVDGHHEESISAAAARIAPGVNLICFANRDARNRCHRYEIDSELDRQRSTIRLDYFRAPAKPKPPPRQCTAAAAVALAAAALVSRLRRGAATIPAASAPLLPRKQHVHRRRALLPMSRFLLRHSSRRLPVVHPDKALHPEAPSSGNHHLMWQRPTIAIAHRRCSRSSFWWRRL